MMFCEKCGSILLPKKDKTGKQVLGCRSCNFVSKKRESIVLKEKMKTMGEGISLVEKRVETLPKVKEICPKCNHGESYYWTVQTRAADEAETRFFKCVKCSHTWRSYT